MSKIGKLPIQISDKVKVEVDSEMIKVEGPKGVLSTKLLRGIIVRVEDGQIVLDRKNDNDQTKAFHGLLRSLIANMVHGVTEGWVKNLELVGTGYRAALQGRNLSLSLGYSHPILVEAPDSIEFKVEGQNKITVSGIDRQLVGQVAAKIRAARPPEPYKGKGVRYAGEKIRRKAGKAATASAS